MKVFDKENIWSFVVILFAILFVYYMPFVLSKVFFLGLLVLMYKSKKDYFWIAILFIMIDAPGRLFVGGDLNDTHRLPFYTIASGISFSFQELFLFVLAFKYIIQKRKIHFYFQKEFLIIIGLGLLIIFYSFLIEPSISLIISGLRIILPWTFIILISIAMPKEKDFFLLTKILFPFVFIALISQFYTYAIGNYIGFELKGLDIINTVDLKMTGNEDRVLRVAESSFLLVFSFATALIYLLSNRSNYSNGYLITIIFVSTLSVFLSATRGWILGYIIVYLFTLLTFASLKGHLVKIIAISISILFLLFIIKPELMIQFRNSYKRLLSVVSIVEGNEEAVENLDRLSYRGPRVMNKFKENPILGWGFTSEYFAYTDRHVGNQSILLNVGVIGFSILIIVYLRLINKIYIVTRWLGVNINYSYKYYIIYSFLFIALFIIHSSSGQGWGLHVNWPNILNFALVLASINSLINHNK